jgi:hypothetical protein
MSWEIQDGQELGVKTPELGYYVFSRCCRRATYGLNSEFPYACGMIRMLFTLGVFMRIGKDGHKIKECFAAAWIRDKHSEWPFLCYNGSRAQDPVIKPRHPAHWGKLENGAVAGYARR